MNQTYRHLLAILGLFMLLSAAVAQPNEKAAERMDFNRYADAAKLLQKKVKKSPENADIAEQLAFAYMKLHRFQEAEFYFEKADQLGGLSNAGLIHFSQTLVKNEKKELAIAYIERFIKAEPESFVAQLMLRSIEKTADWSLDQSAFMLKPTLELNSSRSDFSPIPFGKGIIYATERHIDHVNEDASSFNNEPYLAMYYAVNDKREPEGFAYKRSKPFLSNLNRDDHVGPISIDTVHNLIYFTLAPSRLGKAKNVSHLEIHTASLKGENRLTNERVFLASDTASMAHPSISPDGNTLVFASDMQGTTGKMDLYMMEKKDGGWSNPQNLSALINTPLNEVFPYLKNDSTLFFSSDGHPGFGGLDLFVSHLTDGKWQPPINLKTPINSTKDDFGICFINENKGLFSSARDGGQGKDDIYGFIQISPVNDTQRIEVKGLFDYANLPSTGVSLSLLDEDNNLMFTTQTDAAGYFDFGLLPVNQAYKVRINDADEGMLINSNIYVLNEDGQKVQLMEKEGATSFTFITLPKDAFDLLPTLEDEMDRSTAHVDGLFTFQNLPKEGVSLSLIDNNDAVLGTTTTDANGRFAFDALELDQNYLIRVNTTDQSLLLNSNIFVLNSEGEKVMVMRKEGAASFVFTSLPSEEVDGLSALAEMDSERLDYDLFGQLFSKLGKDIADIELIAITQDGSIIATSFSDTSGFYAFLNLPKNQYVVIKVKSNDSTIYRSSVFYEDDIGITRLEKPESEYFRVSFDEIVQPSTQESKKAQYTVFTAINESPIVGQAVALFDENDKVLHVAKTNNQGSFTIFGTLPGDPYRLLLPASYENESETASIHLVDRIANRFVDARALNKRNHIFAALPDVGDLLSSEDMNFLTKPADIKGRIYKKLPGDFNEGMTLYAYDEDGNLIETVVTDEEGNFVFNKLRPHQNYLIKPETEDISQFSLQLMDMAGNPGEELRLADLQAYVYKSLEAEKSQRLGAIETKDAEMPVLADFITGQIYYKLPGDYKAGIKVYAFDDKGNKIDSTYTDGNGGFKFTRLSQSEDFSIQVMDASDETLQVALFNYDGSFKGLLFLDQNMTFKYSKIIMEAAADLGNDAEIDKSEGVLLGQVYKKLPGDYHKKLSVYAFDEDGNLIDVAQVDGDGNFKFYKLNKDQDYLFKFSEDESNFNIALLDSEGNVMDKTAGTDGTWVYTKLAMDEYNLKTINAADDGSGDKNMTSYIEGNEEDYRKKQEQIEQAAREKEARAKQQAEAEAAKLAQEAERKRLEEQRARELAAQRNIPKAEDGEVFYAYRSAELTEETKNYLDEIIRSWKADPAQFVKIESYTDPSEQAGHRSYAALRSATIAQYFYANGIPIEKMLVANWETAQPAVDCKDVTCTEEQRARNRRSTLGLLDPTAVREAPQYMFTYEFNQWRLNDAGEKTAYQLLRTMRENPATEVVIDGYADTWGGFESNDRISELRAQNIENLLLLKGIDASRIQRVQHGEIIPTGQCILYYPCPVQERMQNRRVEIRLK